MSFIKKTLLLTGIVFIIFVIYLYIQKIIIITIIKSELPEIEASNGLYLPWPLKPRFISKVKGDSSLYKLAIDNGGIIESKTLKVVIMASDGTVFVNYK